MDNHDQGGLSDGHPTCISRCLALLRSGYASYFLGRCCGWQQRVDHVLDIVPFPSIEKNLFLGFLMEAVHVRWRRCLIEKVHYTRPSHAVETTAVTVGLLDRKAALLYGKILHILVNKLVCFFRAWREAQHGGLIPCRLAI